MKGIKTMKFNFDNERPIYIQLVEQLRIGILTSEFGIGEKIPSVRDLAMLAKVNPNTMQKALAELEEEKLIYTERTNGKFVTKDTKLIKKFRDNLAKEKANDFFSSMKMIGIDENESIKYLLELLNK